MTAIQILLNIAAYACFSLGTLLVWPSRRNVLAWLGVPFFVIAYVIPLLVINYRDFADERALSTLTRLNTIGALAMVAGIVTATRIWAPRPTAGRVGGLAAASLPDISTERVFQVMLTGCLLMTFCFVWMGGPPILADDPFQAKFFKGDYKVKYDQVSILFRLSQVLLATALPLAIPATLEQRSGRLLAVTLWAVALFAAALSRGAVVAGAVLVLAAWCSQTTWRMVVFLVLATIVYSIGSSIYVVLGFVVVDDFDVWTEIARGAPDIVDHLDFLRAFNPESDLSFGMTFIGGLIPGNFYFNPSVFTLAITNDTSDISEIASGGFRLPPSVSGYAALAWSGAIVVPLVSGLITGYFTSILRALATRRLSSHVAALLWYQVYASFAILFYAMAYQALLAVFIFWYMAFNPFKVSRRFFKARHRRIAPNQEPRARNSPDAAS